MHLAGRWLILLTCVLGLFSKAWAFEIERATADDQTRFLVVKGAFVEDEDEGRILAEAADFDPTFVTFSSGGGNIAAAMRFGRMMRRIGMPTAQPRTLECASACMLAFVGGSRRVAEAGAIGVHRSSFSSDNPVGTTDAVAAVQASTAEVMSYLGEMGVDPSLLQLSLSVDETDMRYLTSTEMQRYHVTDATGAPATPVASSALDPSAQTPTVGDAQAYASVNPAAPSPIGSTSLPATALPADRPTRIVLYDGLDFSGRDISNTVVSDASSCMMQCRSNSSCKAFTFNTRTRPGRGPNCFLKSSRGQYDGNSAAISGLLLGRLDPDPQTMTFGVIDPTVNLYKDVDVVGSDLSSKPLSGAVTPFDCRMACVNDGRCAAFTFVPKKKQCWLKSTVGQTRNLSGVITGAKVSMTYTPRVVGLE